MKRYALCLTLALLLCKVGFAQDAVAGDADYSTKMVEVAGPTPTLQLDAKTPLAIQRLADGLHILDNGTPSTFYDANNGVWLAGIITTPYKKFWISIDFGGAAPMTEGASMEFISGARFHAGEFAYDKIPLIHDFVQNNPVIRDGLFKYTAAGAFFSRDWTEKTNRFGPYAGLEYRFK